MSEKPKRTNLAQLTVTPKRGQSFRTTAEYAIGIREYLRTNVLLIYKNKRLMVRYGDTVETLARRKV